MPNCKLEYTNKFKTAPKVRRILGLSRFQLDIRIQRRILPEPTFVDTSGVRYFDDHWLRVARAILYESPVQPKGLPVADQQQPQEAAT